MKIPRSSNRYQARLLAAAVLAVLAVAAAMPTSGVAGAQRSASSAAVKTRKISGVGVVLVNAKGRTLYVFMKDARRHVTCTGSCAIYWPPLKWKGSGRPKAGGSAKTRLLGLDKSPAGGKVVTYSKWPLYTYAGDSRAGQDNGENLNQNGGRWYVISAKGKLVKHRH